MNLIDARRDAFVTPMSIHVGGSRKIAIWGSYHNGNFGDDLMAIMLAAQLQAHGYTVSVFRLDAAIARRHGVVTTESLDELLTGAGCCVLGGGAFLTSDGAHDRFYAALLRDLAALDAALTSRNIPIVGVSLGGSGRSDPRDVPPAVWRLMKNPLFRGTSVRLPMDVSSLESLGKRVEYYPDMVFTAADFHGRKSTTTARTSDVLVQYHKSGQTMLLFLPAIRLARAMGRRIRFVRTQLSAHSQNAMELGEHASVTCEYQTPVGLLDDLAATGIVISGKLHIGVAAVSMGKCFVSLAGREKSASFLATIDRSRFYIPKRRAFRVIRLLLSKRVSSSYEREFQLPGLTELKQAAARHYAFMLEQVNGCVQMDARTVSST